MQLEIITPEKVVFKEEIDELIVPTDKGQITILPHHINLLTKIAPGEMTAKIKGKFQHLAVTGGFVEVSNGQISVLADYAVRSEDIEVNKALEAQKRAEEILKNKTEQISERDLIIAQSDIIKAVLELKVANRHRRTTNS